MLRNALLVLSIAVCGGPYLAGPAVPEGIPTAAPIWTARFDATILWQRVAPVGTLVVGTTAGIHGVDPTTGTRIWHAPGLGNLSAESFQPIFNSPFVMFAEDGRNDRIVILDAMTGTVLFSSQSAGLRQVLSTHLLPASHGLLVFGIREAKTAMVLLDIPTGKQRWVNEDFLAGTGGLLKLATTLLQSLADQSGVTDEPLEVGKDSFLLGTSFGVQRISAIDGKIQWSLPPVMGASRAYVHGAPRHPEIFFVASEVESSGSQAPLVYTYYTAHRVTDGEKVWPKPIKIKGSANEPIFIDSGVVLSTAPDGGGKIKLVDRASGKSLWGKKGKGLDVPGSVVDHVLLDPQSLLLVTGKDSVWTRSGADYFFNVVDMKSGDWRYAKPLKVRGRLLYTEKLPAGVLYVTTSEFNIIDPATGETRFERSIVSDGSLVTASEGERLYAFSQQDGALYTVDKPSGKLNLLSKEKIRFGDKEVVETLEVAADRITVLSGQNVVIFDRDGTLQSHAHYPAPKHPTVVRVLYGALAIRAAMSSAVSGVYSGAFAEEAADQKHGSLGHVMAGELSRGYGELSRGYAGLSEDYFRAMNARFKQSARSSDFVFMMTRFREEGIGLAGVSKVTGKIVSKVELGKDREPEYAVDAIANRLYYQTAADSITGFAF